MPTVSDFLIDRLVNTGVGHVFGLPGDYVLGFYDKLSKRKDLQLVNSTDENHAGFAADAYARVHGIGCVCVTYSVGGLKLCNSIAGAYAEKSPVIVISGSPGIKERGENMILHHVAGSFEAQREVFKNYTCASAFLSNPVTAGYEIDRVIDAVKYYKQPGYIELPRDIADKPVTYDVYNIGTPKLPVSDEENLEEALFEVRQWIERAKRPAIIAGVEVARHDLGKELITFAEKTGIPVCTTLLSKSVVSERHPLFAGIYTGAASQEQARTLVEESDCLLMFGVMLTDMALSFNPKRFNRRQTVRCNVESLKVSNHTYTNVLFKDFCENLFLQKDKIPKSIYKNNPISIQKVEKKTFEPQDKPISAERFFTAVDAMLQENMAIVADIGDSLFGACDLMMHHSNQFLGPAFYTSMGFAIPASLGVQLAKPDLRPVVLVGDGAFQMSSSELSAILDQGLNPIVFIINNGGYTTERYLKEGSYNDIRTWNYTQIVNLLNGGRSVRCTDEISLHKTIEEAISSKELFLIEIVLGKMDVSPALKRMTDGLSKRV